jgi:hypothetical protein
MEERDVKTWDEFKAEILNLHMECKNSTESANTLLLFRGQENSCWPLDTTLERNRRKMLFKDYYRSISRIKPQIESLTGTSWSIPDYPVVERQVEEYDDFHTVLWSGHCPGYSYMALRASE